MVKRLTISVYQAGVMIALEDHKVLWGAKIIGEKKYNSYTQPLFFFNMHSLYKEYKRESFFNLSQKILLLLPMSIHWELPIITSVYQKWPKNSWNDVNSEIGVIYGVISVISSLYFDCLDKQQSQI